jgi:hypothetical protein
VACIDKRRKRVHTAAAAAAPCAYRLPRRRAASDKLFVHFAASIVLYFVLVRFGFKANKTDCFLEMHYLELPSQVLPLCATVAGPRAHDATLSGDFRFDMK